MGDASLVVEPDMVGVDLVERMAGQQRVKHQVQRAGDHDQAAAGRIETGQRFPGPGHQTKRLESVDQILPPGSGLLPAAHVEGDPFRVGQATLAIQREALLVLVGPSGEPLVEHLPDGPVARRLNQGSVDIEGHQVVTAPCRLGGGH